MFWDDIVLVTELVEKYGLRQPFFDLGGLERPCIADYDITIKTGVQERRYISLNQRPFDHIDKDYVIINPELGGELIEDLPAKYEDYIGTAVCLNVLEHVNNPFEVFEALHKIMKEDSLLIIETVFSFPYHPSPNDFWRFSPECLKYIAERTGFKVLEYDWRLIITADKGILELNTKRPQEIKSVYAVLTKGEFTRRRGGNHTLPEQIINNGSISPGGNKMRALAKGGAKKIKQIIRERLHR